ncbi:MAG TPA: efflux RND transporter permease subunit [Candidatus Saccharimonadales bacterium]|nr:efflux RND transporter permease subunit [Candidatus Saccharimonadales bacterium]
MKKKLAKVYNKDGQDRLLPKLSLFIFDRARLAAILWIGLTLFGVISYTSLLKREGFPSVNFPFSVIGGAYLVSDPARVDKEVAKPISDIVLKDNRVKSVQSQAQGVAYSIAIQYQEGTDATQAGKELEKRIQDAGVLPKQAVMKVETPKFGFTERGDDGAISVYAKEKSVSAQELTVEAERVARYIEDKRLANLESISVIDPFVEGVDPATGKMATRQTKFDRYGERTGNANKFYDSASVGFMQKDGTDVIELNDQIEAAVAEYNTKNPDARFSSVVSATYAHDIKDQMSELQRALLEGLLAVLLIGSIIIAIRASIITVISMLTVLAITIGILYATGYTLNTITLFSLILCLGLIVDDTIIMVEAIDAERRRRKEPRETVEVATRKVSRAMVAATTTAALSFAPLLFVSGILGSFIRAIPVTVITSLVVSLFVALIFIPLFARYLLLGKKQMGAENVREPAARVEAKIAAFIGKPMLWARHSKKKLFAVGISAVLVGLAFIAAALFLFQKVTFNIFPPSKDSNGLVMQMTFTPGTTIEQAERLADRADAIMADNLGKNFKTASYYSNTSAQQATMTAYIISYQKRDITSAQLEKQLEEKFKNFEGARVHVNQLDVGPPPAAFSVRIQTDNREAALRLAEDINKFMTGRELTRLSGEKARITETSVSDPGTYVRDNGAAYVSVTATFDATDTTALVGLAQAAVEKEFTAERLKAYGLNEEALKYDFGQEEENQESFATLALAFPILLFVMYLLLALQFRSLSQPLLIFMAIPFSLFGITLGLYFSNNAFSFFAMLGFFALIGLSLKNTILLTDYANQLRRKGTPAVEAAVGALGERFRPLVATSLTAVASLIPLALASPFWEGLTVVLICGLLSSTFLVITVFPYYYLGAEYLRLRVSRKACLLWLGLTITISAGLIKAGVKPLVIPLIALGVLTVQIVISKLLRKKQKKQ